jgi:AcrR family transcriptional regulator
VYETVSFTLGQQVTESIAPGSAGEFPVDVGHPRRGRGRESAIREAALELLAEVGYDRMSMDAVAARAHASKATIYRRWPGKSELVLDAVRCRAADDLDPPDTGSLRGDLLATLRVMIDGMGSADADLMAGMLRAMQSAPELAACVRAQLIEQKRYVARTLVARAVSRGEISAATDPEVFHEIAPALIFFRLVVLRAPVDDAFLAHIVDDVLIPLLVRTGQVKNPQEK